MADINDGKLIVWVTYTDSLIPIADAKIEIYDETGNLNPLSTTTSGDDGFTDEINLSAPSYEYSQNPSDNKPYSEYNVRISKEGFYEEFISNIQIFPTITEQLHISLKAIDYTFPEVAPIVIEPHTLWQMYPPKIAESEIKPEGFSGEIVLKSVVIPETIIVHDGPPSDSSAKNYYVPYLDYIKNVCSSEIYSTWPEATIIANVLAIMSFTLNRVYTEWYRNKGYNFTITTSTAFDQKWMQGKSIPSNISSIVDNLYNNYLAKPNVKQPLFTQYCDGNRVKCPNWMSQWGSKYLGDDGFSAIEILRYYYGNEIYINNAASVAGIPYSFPDTNLTIGSYGEDVIHLQTLLNGIRKGYPALPLLSVDGIYGNATSNAVKQFQKIFNLPETGIVDYATWYKISQIYVGVTKIAERF